MSRLPIRTRLTAFYVFGLALVLLSLGVFVVTRLRADVTSELDRELSGGAAQVATGYAREGPAEFRDVVRSVLPGPRSQGTGAQVLDPAGRVVLAEGHRVVRRPLLTADERRRALGGERVVVSRAGQRIVARSVRLRGRRLALAVTSSLAEVDEAAREVRTLLLLGGGAALLLVGGGAWWLARAALRPVERMTTRADAIGPADLSERVAVPAARDEVGHLARTLNAMLDRIEAGVAAREALVADAAHELRAPLAALRTELQVSLREDELAAGARATLESALEEVDRLSRTVADLLMLARVDQGGLELLRAPLDLRRAAQAAARSRARPAAAREVSLVVDGEPVEVVGDRDRLDQVLGNLLDNAIRFAPTGTEVRVSTWGNGARAGVRVADAGPGVPPEARERVFERFAREDSARGRDGGAGLGLAICREIVRAHGGAIWVQDADPRGAVFTVALPR